MTTTTLLSNKIHINTEDYLIDKDKFIKSMIELYATKKELFINFVNTNKNNFINQYTNTKYINFELSFENDHLHINFMKIDKVIVEINGTDIPNIQNYITDKNKNALITYLTNHPFDYKNHKIMSFLTQTPTIKTKFSILYERNNSTLTIQVDLFLHGTQELKKEQDEQEKELKQKKVKYDKKVKHLDTTTLKPYVVDMYKNSLEIEPNKTLYPQEYTKEYINNHKELFIKELTNLQQTTNLLERYKLINNPYNVYRSFMFKVPLPK